MHFTVEYVEAEGMLRKNKITIRKLKLFKNYQPIHNFFKTIFFRAIFKISTR